MTKITLSDVSNILGNPTSAANTINANNDVIVAALDLLVSRDGETPNQMTADIDLNNNDLLNVSQAHVDELFINGSEVTPDELQTIPSTVMRKSVYDPQLKQTDVFESSNHDFQQSDANSVEESVEAKLSRWVDVEDFGAVAYTKAQLEALNGGPSITTQAAANVTAFQNAMNAMSARGGGAVFCHGQFYVLSARLERPAGVYLIGENVGEWEPIFPNRAKTWTGTTLLFKGTGTRDVTFDGITSMEHGGGWREDPDNPGAYFKLWSAYNSNATGTTAATQRNFSAAILVKENTNYGGLHNLRVVNWTGTNGIADWSNTASTSLGDDWDFGYVLRNAEYADDYNIQVVGGWREAAHAQITTAITDSRSERNRIVRAKFQGKIGLLIRAMDQWDITATTATTVTIRWTNQIYFNPSGGTFRGSDNATYTYTGVTHTGSDADYVFTGVTPDPSAAGIFHIRHAGAGFGNAEYQDIYAYGLDHQNGGVASAYGLIDSKALEVSGFPLRGIKFRNTKFHTREAVVSHFHITSDLVFIDPQFEGTAHMIASPVTTDQSYAAAPVSDTRGTIMIAGAGVADQDLRLFLPRNGFIEELQLSPRSDLNGHANLRPLRSGKEAYIENFDSTAVFRVFNSGAATVEAGDATRMQFFTSGNVAPGADNTQSFGISSTRWANGFITNLKPGAGTVTWTSGAGTPEGAVTAVVGSFYTDTSTGIAYAKKTGAGNTGWFPMHTFLSNTATFDPPSLADAAGTSTTVTVTGAALGDVALASFSLSTQGITVTANVTATDTVTVRFQNETGGVIDLASGTLKAVVLK